MRPEKLLVTCDTCGDQRVPSSAMTLVITETEQLAYCFRCDGCGELTVRTCNEELAQRLRHVGVEPRRVDLERAADDPPPFTMRDVVAFVQTLRGEDHVVRLVIER